MLLMHKNKESGNPSPREHVDPVSSSRGVDTRREGQQQSTPAHAVAACQTSTQVDTNNEL